MPTRTASRRSPPYRPHPGKSSMRSTVLVVLGATAILVALLVVVAVLAGGGATPAATPAVEVDMGEFWFEPSTIEVEAGTELTVRVVNTGQQTHDLKLEGREGTRFLLDGESQEVDLGVIEAATRAWCTVPGHLEAGMVMDIVVTP